MHGSDVRTWMEPYYLIIHVKTVFLKFISTQGIKISLLKFTQFTQYQYWTLKNLSNGVR